jgi:hypothetical protein
MQRRVRRALAPLCRAARLALLAALLSAPTGTARADAEVLQGGFRFFDPDAPQSREASLLSLGPLVLGGARARMAPSGDDFGICKEIVFVMLGSEGSRRTESSVRLRQRDYVVAFFVFAECIGDEELCLAGASEPVAVPGCAASLKLSKRDGIRGDAKLQCRQGLPISDPDFGLSGAEQTWLADAFPGLESRFAFSFTDPAAEEVTGDDLAFKIQNLDVDALDDIVGTYLADDDLEDCDD